MSGFAEFLTVAKTKIEDFISEAKKELKPEEYRGSNIATHFKTQTQTYPETLDSSSVSETSFDVLFIMNFHGYAFGDPITIGSRDIFINSSLPDKKGILPDNNLIDVFIGSVDYDNGGEMSKIIENKEQARKYGSLIFLRLFEYILYPKLFEILEKIKHNILEKIKHHILSDNDVENEITELQELFLPYENPPDINDFVTRIYAYVNAMKTESVFAFNVKTVETFLDEQLNEIVELYMSYIITELKEINLRFGTYVEYCPNLKLEGKHSDDPEDSMMGFFVGTYNGTLLDICFKHIIDSQEFEDFLIENGDTYYINDETNVIDPGYLKQKEHCILREGSLTYYILKFLGEKYFKKTDTLDLTKRATDKNRELLTEDVTLAHEERYNWLFDNLSQDYNANQLTLPDEEPYQTELSYIIDFINYIKCFAINYHEEYIENNEKKTHSYYMKLVDKGAVPACSYLFTCLKYYENAVGTIFRRLPTYPKNAGPKKAGPIRGKSIRPVRPVRPKKGGTKKKRRNKSIKRKKQKRKKSMKRGYYSYSK